MHTVHFSWKLPCNSKQNLTTSNNDFSLEIVEPLKPEGFALAPKIGSENLAQKISPTQDGFHGV